MHIVILAAGYPSVYSSMHGVFFRDQAETLQRADNEIGLIVINPISINSVLLSKKISFGENHFIKNGVRTKIYKFLNIPKFHKYRIHKSLSKGMKMFEEYVKEFGIPEIIHVHKFQLSELAIAIKEKYHVPYIVTEHSTGFQEDVIPKSMERYVQRGFENSAVNIAVSNELADLLSTRYNVPFRFVPNVVNTSEFKAIRVKNENGYYTFFNAGNLVAQKNQELLIQAFSVLASKYDNLRLRIAGAGILESELKKQVASLQLEDQVEFLGLLPRSKVIHEMQLMDTFVLSSRSETFGVVIIEALSCGKPVIATKCGGPESIITSDDYGLLCEQEKDSLTHAMEQVYLNRQRYDSDKIRDYAINNYSEDAVAKQLMNIYREIIKLK